jgi:hypothetical protein
MLEVRSHKDSRASVPVHSSVIESRLVRLNTQYFLPGKADWILRLVALRKLKGWDSSRSGWAESSIGKSRINSRLWLNLKLKWFVRRYVSKRC